MTHFRLPGFVTRLLLAWANKHAKRAPDQVLQSGGCPYLSRWWIVRRAKARWCRFNIYLHLTHRSDGDRCLHDHPWRFFSIILLQGYDELIGDSMGRQIGRRSWKPGDFIYRPLGSPHRLVLRDHKPSLSIIVCGRKRRPWGFWVRPGMWLHWQKYVDGPRA